MSVAAAPSREARGDAAARRRLSVAQWFGLTLGLLLVVAVAGIVAGILSLHTLGEKRRLLFDRLAPATTAAQQLAVSGLDGETGVRGYALGRDPEFLQPYYDGIRTARPAAFALLKLAPAEGVGLQRELAATLQSGAAWRRQFAEPTIARIREGGPAPTRAQERQGKVLFDRFRRSNALFIQRLEALRVDGRAALGQAASRAQVIFIVFGVVLLLSMLGIGYVLRRVVVAPIAGLASGVRDVAGGAYHRRVEAGGAREVRALGEDVDEMRERIVQEVAQLQAARDDLARSNAELEQFAYVASHDLQEPLRKVASFCQMLQRRYGGQLDARGEQYIEFAVDGAKRMQDLINDLLSFSRVGRVAEAPTIVRGDDIIARVRTSLADAIEQTGATIEADPLPALRGEASLLALVFQNLIANGMKFQAEGVPPVVRIGVQRDGDMWRFTVADNGIGIEDEYAERIFIIFQRLHPRSAYEGTGIGLAMCRKVVEYHGGTIWLETGDDSAGATFHFTLPVLEEELTP